MRGGGGRGEGERGGGVIRWEKRIYHNLQCIHGVIVIQLQWEGHNIT